MRLWGVNPRTMCRQHLLGEHVEMHMVAGSVRRGRPLGRLLDGFVDLARVRRRHRELAVEMKRRGYCHKSPLLPMGHVRGGRIDVQENAVELQRRCRACRRLK